MCKSFQPHKTFHMPLRNTQGTTFLGYLDEWIIMMDVFSETCSVASLALSKKLAIN